MFDDFRIAFLTESGEIGPFMDARDVMDDTQDTRSAVNLFAQEIERSPLRFSVNLRVGNYPAVSVAWRSIGSSAAVCSISSGQRSADLVLMLSRSDRTNEKIDMAALKAATGGIYEAHVVDRMLEDIAATNGPVVVVARPPGALSPKMEVALDRTAARVAAAFFGQIP